MYILRVRNIEIDENNPHTGHVILSGKLTR